MATAQFSGIITSLKGRIGGTVFKGNRSGQTVQNITSSRGSYALRDGKRSRKPSAQQLIQVQNNISIISGLWRGLNDSQRLAWQAASPDFPFTNKYGINYTGSGFQLFCQCNLNLIQSGQATIEDPPAPGTLPSFPDYSVAIVGPNLIFTISTSTSGDWSVLLFASTTVSNGKAYSKGLMKAIYLRDDATVGDYNITSEYKNIFGNITPSGKIYFYGILINQLTGRASLASIIVISV